MKLDRRRFVAAATSTLGMLSMSGCLADDAIDAASSVDGGSGDDGDGGSSGSDGDSTSGVELTDASFETTSQQMRGTFEFTNGGEEDAEAEFATAVNIGTDGVYGTHRNATTVSVPAGDTATTELMLVEGSRLSTVAREEFNNGYIEVVATVDGAEADQWTSGDQPSRHLSFRVLYSGEWQGAVGGDGGVRSVQGSGSQHLPVDNGASIISGNAQKTDQTAQALIVQIIVDGAVVAEQVTTAGFGVAQVSAQASASPISNPREPYRPPEVTLSPPATESSGGDDGEWSRGDTETVPGEQAARETARNYYTALVSADADAVNQLLHPDSPMAAFTDEEVAPYEQYRQEIEAMSVISLDRERGVAAVRSEITLIDQENSTGETIESILELRVYDGEWRVWQLGE